MSRKPNNYNFKGDVGNLSLGDRHKGDMSVVNRRKRPADPAAAGDGVEKSDEGTMTFQRNVGNFSLGDDHTGKMTVENIEETSGADSGEKGGAKEPILHFGHANTAALLVAGAGTSGKTFKNDVDWMVDLLKGSVGISEDNIFTIKPRPIWEMKKKIEVAIDDVKAVLGDTNNGHLIFYYSGHFTKAKGFKVDDRKEDKRDYYLDKELADELLKIPAKYVLLILDMCYSGSAEVGAKDDDGLPKNEKDEDVPLLWEYCIKGIQPKGAEGGDTCAAEKVVQWSSSGDEESFTYKPTQSSFFTKAIIDVITCPEAGKEIRKEMKTEETHVTVLHLNEHVKNHVQKGLEQHKKVQTPVIRPEYADSKYFKTFPHFVKIVKS